MSEDSLVGSAASSFEWDVCAGDTVLLPVPLEDSELFPDEWANEFMKSELHYVHRILAVLYNSLLEMRQLCAQDEALDPDDVNYIFVNVDSIYPAQAKALDALVQGHCDRYHDFVHTLAAAFAGPYEHLFVLYEEYVLGFRKGIELARALKSRHTAFALRLRVFANTYGVTLEHMLESVATRIGHYLRYMAGIHAALLQVGSKDTLLLEQVDGVTGQLQGKMLDLSRALRDSNKAENVGVLQKLLGGGSSLLHPARYTVKYGKLRFMNPKSEKVKDKYYLFVVFNDLFVYGSMTRGKYRKGTIKDSTSLHKVEVSKYEPRSPVQGSILRVDVTGEKHPLLMIARSVHDRDDWVRSITTAKQNLERDAELQKQGKEAYNSLFGRNTVGKSRGKLKREDSFLPSPSNRNSEPSMSKNAGVSIDLCLLKYRQYVETDLSQHITDMITEE